MDRFSQAFPTLAALAEATGRERHGLEIRDYSVFAGAEEPEHAPSNKGRLYRPEGIDLRPRPASPIVDAGCHLAGINAPRHRRPETSASTTRTAIRPLPTSPRN